jgi:hypothetical protein
VALGKTWRRNLPSLCRSEALKTKRVTARRRNETHETNSLVWVGFLPVDVKKESRTLKAMSEPLMMKD